MNQKTFKDVLIAVLFAVLAASIILNLLQDNLIKRLTSELEDATYSSYIVSNQGEGNPE